MGGKSWIDEIVCHGSRMLCSPQIMRWVYMDTFQDHMLCVTEIVK